MKLVKIDKNSVSLVPFTKKVPNVFIPVLSLLILWLPLKEVVTAGFPNIVNFSGFIAPALVMISLIAMWAETGIKIELKGIEKAFLLFLFLTTISSLLSILVYGEVAAVIKDTFVVYELFALYILGKNLKKENFLFLITVGVSVAVIIALYGIWQFYSKVPMPELWVVPGEILRTRAFATFGSPNAFATYLLAWFWLSLVLVKERGQKWTISLIFILSALAFTYSRSTVLAFVLGSSLLFFLLDRKRRKNFLIIFSLLISVLLLFFIKRFANFLDPTYIFYTTEAGRIWAIKNVLSILTDHLFYGVGMGMYGGKTAADILSPVYLESVQHGFVATYLTDNQYLQILIQQGIFGLISYLSLMFFISKRLYEKAKVNIVPGGIIFSAWISYSLLGFSENIWFIQATATIIWIAIGYGVKNEKENSDTL